VAPVPSDPSVPRLSPALVFAAVLGPMVAITAAAWLFEPGLGRGSTISLAERPSDDYYLAHDHGGHVDHHVLYFGTDPVAVEHMKRADVLFLGNSRLMFAARPEVFDPYFASRGLRYYILGFGFREADRFPLAIIERFDLRPDLVIVNADGFFMNSLSDFARVVMKDTAFGAWKFRQEAETGHEVRRVLHEMVPNWIDQFGRTGFPWRRELVIYRSRSNGGWQLSPWLPGRVPVSGRALDAPPLAEREVAAARRFKEALERRGSRLVLTYVPTPRPFGGGPALLAELLDVPLVAVHPPHLLSEDGDHLDEASSVAWSQAFVRELERTAQ
jgi:hypothetical protein